MLRAGVRLLMFVLGLAMVCFAMFTGGTAMALCVMAGVSLIGLPLLLASNPSSPNAARALQPHQRLRPPARHDRTDDNGNPLWWDAREKRWIGKAAGNPYAEPVGFDAAFGPDALAPYEKTIQGLRADHARGALSSEALADCIDNIEQVAGVRARDADDPMARLKKMGEAYKSAPGKRPAESDTITQLTAALVKLEAEAKAAERAIAKMKPIKATDAPGQIAMALPRTCNQCASVYTNAYRPVARYCDGSCKD